MEFVLASIANVSLIFSSVVISVFLTLKLILTSRHQSLWFRDFEILRIVELESVIACNEIGTTSSYMNHIYGPHDAWILK